MGGIGYLGYTKVIGLTSTTPAAVPSFDGTDELYVAAKQKLADFNHDVKNHQAATIQLSADEINILIARNPDVIKNHLHAFVTLTGNEARVQASLPTDELSQGLIKGRYVNFDSSFEVHFDPSLKSLGLVFHTLQFGDKVLLGPSSDKRSFRALVHSHLQSIVQRSHPKKTRGRGPARPGQIDPDRQRPIGDRDAVGDCSGGL